MKTADRLDVSVVIPLFDEEDNVGPLCEAVRAALASWDRDYEVLLVDDGSSDRTREKMLLERERDRRVRPLFLERNAGQTLAMAAGFSHADGRIIVSMDGDLQNDPFDIPMMVERIDHGFDVVCGWRRERQDAWLSRTLPSKIANRLIAWMTGVPIHDNGCSLKAYRAEVIRSLHLYSDMHRFLPALSSMTGARIDEVVVRHHPRAHGESKYGISRTFKVLADMITIKMITQFSSRPGRWFAMLSGPWLLLALISGVVGTTGLWLFDRESSVVFASLAVVLFYLFGSLMSLSVISEILLANRDRRYSRRLASVLTVEATDESGAVGSGTHGEAGE